MKITVITTNGIPKHRITDKQSVREQELHKAKRFYAAVTKELKAISVPGLTTEHKITIEYLADKNRMTVRYAFSGRIQDDPKNAIDGINSAFNKARNKVDLDEIRF